MNRLFRLISVLICGLLFLTTACEPDPSTYMGLTQNPDLYHQAHQNLTDIIVYDIFSPPVASRIYAYPNIAAYEVMSQSSDAYQSLAGQLQGLTPVPQAPPGQDISMSLAALEAFMVVGRTLIFSEQKQIDFRNKMIASLQEEGVPPAVLKRSFEYGQTVAEHILAWADQDNYKQTRTFPRFSVNTDIASRWTPTPPDYMDGIEPHWNKIRPFVIDSATQFVPIPPTDFDMDKRSTFYAEVMEVYEAVNTLDQEKKEIAEFWDCNPFVTHHRGHVMFATKKITPGGHWIGITKIACKKANADFMETINTYTRTSIALADAFISCWDEKYRSNLIRPQTVINKYIDEDWNPLLQTPPFPEYTSGHSVISTAAAITLTDIYGESFSFMDSTEVRYGLTAREFDSFIDASSEAAISRLYGGIHYMPAITQGVEQGKKVGNYVVQNLITKVK